MKSIVVYESLWGNTAAIARAIAEGLGEGSVALSTAQATADAVESAELIVGGAPLLGFNLPTEEIRNSIAKDASAPSADFTHPSMREWLAGLAPGSGHSASFETRIWWSPGSAAKKIGAALEGAGYAQIGRPEAFIVTGRYGPLKDGELDRARDWGSKLAALLS